MSSFFRDRAKSAGKSKGIPQGLKPPSLPGPRDPRLKPWGYLEARATNATLVGCGLRDVVDDEHVDGAFFGFEFQAERLLEGVEEAGGGLDAVSEGGDLWRMAVEERVVGGKDEVHVEAAGEAGLVDDGAVEDEHLEEAGEVGEVRS